MTGLQRYQLAAFRWPMAPRLIAGEAVSLPVAKFAWLPCRLADGSWTWMRPIWAWSAVQKQLIHPASFTLYTRRWRGRRMILAVRSAGGLSGEVVIDEFAFEEPAL